MGRIGWLASGCVGAMALAGVAGCERGASAPSRAQRDDGGGSARSYASRGASSDAGGARAGDGRDDGGGSTSGGYASRGYGASDRGDGGEREATPLFHGKPMWADNRRHTAKENAEYQCDKHGGDIGSKSLDDCLTKVHAFVDDPPAGTEVVVRVRNDDKLMYDAKANMFAVARKDGAPRTFFKPRDGADYWRTQKEEAQSGRRYAGRRGGEEGSGAGGD